MNSKIIWYTLGGISVVMIIGLLIANLVMTSNVLRKNTTDTTGSRVGNTNRSSGNSYDRMESHGFGGPPSGVTPDGSMYKYDASGKKVPDTSSPEPRNSDGGTPDGRMPGGRMSGGGMRGDR